MDTRSKIIGLDAALPRALRPGSLIVTGYFDPLLAAHAKILSDLAAGCDTLMVALLDPPEPLLPARARAELVAALGDVSYVVLLADSQGPLDMPTHRPVLHLEEGDRARFEWLVTHVRERHAPALR